MNDYCANSLGFQEDKLLINAIAGLYIIKNVFFKLSEGLWHKLTSISRGQTLINAIAGNNLH